MGVGGQRHASAALPPEKTRYPFWVDPRTGLDRWKNLAPTGIRSRTVQPVASRYTDCAIPAPYHGLEYVFHECNFWPFRGTDVWLRLT